MMRVLAVALVLSLVGGCVGNGYVTCDDGRVCPADKLCSAVSCVTPEQATACDGLAEGDLCGFSGVADGTCYGGFCEALACGNGIVQATEECDDGAGNSLDPDAACRPGCTGRRCGDAVLDPTAGEVCDDGNLVAGDGCTPNCLSIETCGNGVVDFFANEQCDDSNTRNGDGCGASCAVETYAWRTVTDSSIYVYPDSLLYDVARRRLVATESVGPYPQQVVERNGSRWQRVTTPAAPRINVFARAYDSARGRTIVVGIPNADQTRVETWEFDGTRWLKRDSMLAPSPRYDAAMTFDAKRKRVLLFGGRVSSSLSEAADTWVFDATGWHLLAPPTSPSARSEHAMAYDPVRDRVVLFGGGAAGVSKADTWEFDGATWASRASTLSPPGGRNPRLAYDIDRQHVVAIGGYAFGRTREVWGLATTGWVQVPSIPPGPTDYYASGLAYDASRRVLVAMTGNGEIVELGATDAAWTTPSLPIDPPERGNGAMAYDPRRGEVLLFGGSSAPSFLADTWAFDGTEWREIVTPTRPEPRHTHELLQDTRRDRTLLVGGRSAEDANGNSVEYRDVWQLVSGAWTRVGNLPPATSEGAITYDVARGLVVLFGGMDSAGGTPSSTNALWELDGTTWTQRMLPAAPQSRWGAMLAHDRSRDVCVLYGGVSAAGASLVDTWELDATGWRASVSTGPGVRDRASMVYDTASTSVVLLGGTSTSLLDPWGFDGVWRERPGEMPEGRVDAVTYDEAHRRLVGFDGARKLWSFSAIPVVAGEACSSGIDFDGDGKIGCADDECWAVCTPLCAPGSVPAACTMTPSCGDGTCGPVEDCRSCPGDCAVGTRACPIGCGDSFCDAGETATTCPGDCG